MTIASTCESNCNIDYEEMKAQILQIIQKNGYVEDASIRSVVDEVVEERLTYASIESKLEGEQRLFDELRRLGIIQRYLDDDTVTEIMVNGSKNVFIEKNGSMIKETLAFESVEVLNQLIQKIVSDMDRRVNQKEPICDVRLNDGSRASIVLPPVAIDGPYVTIRKFPKHRFSADEIIDNRTISREAMAFLQSLVKAKYNIFISGGTSSGKTTFLNILSNAIDNEERIITIEDSAELQLNGKHILRLEARNSNNKKDDQITIKDLIKTSLRMRPDRIVVGEVRGEEALDMLHSMNTGHDGSISTGHGNSVDEMLLRLETMVLMGVNLPLYAIRQQIASAIDIMIHIQKINGLGRRVIEIAELGKIEEDHIQKHILYIYNKEKDCLEKVSESLLNDLKFIWNSEDKAVV